MNRPSGSGPPSPPRESNPNPGATYVLDDIQGASPDAKKEAIFALLDGMRAERPPDNPLTFGEFVSSFGLIDQMADALGREDWPEALRGTLEAASNCLCDDADAQPEGVSNAIFPILHKVCSPEPLAADRELSAILRGPDLTAAAMLLGLLPRLGYESGGFSCPSASREALNLARSWDPEVRGAAREALGAILSEGNPLKHLFSKGNSPIPARLESFIASTSSVSLLDELWKLAYVSAVRGSTWGMELAEAIAGHPKITGISLRDASRYKEEAFEFSPIGADSAGATGRADRISRLVKGRVGRDRAASGSRVEAPVWFRGAIKSVTFWHRRGRRRVLGRGGLSNANKVLFMMGTGMRIVDGRGGGKMPSA